MTKFAFVVHPLSRDMRAFIELESQSDMRALLSQGNVMELCRQVQNTLALGSAAGKQMADRVTILDDIGTLRSARGKTTEGRLYEIPLDAYQILENPHEALGYIDEAVRMAAEWGAGIVGLGSMTGVVGGHGTLVAKNSPIPVTTGNSLTVYAALQNLRHVCQETGIDLSGECVAVVGIPGSIATAAAKILASDVGELLLVARRDSERIRQTADKLGARFFTDISAALAHAKIVLSATSTGGCIDQFALQPGSIVVDIGVPADVYGRSAQRDDVLIISGGLTEVPLALGRDSILLQMHLGMVPSCLAETMNLAMESRSECFSLGRELNPDKVSEIGEIAVANGFVFERLLSFGQPVEESMWANFLKVVSTQRCALHRFQRMGESASSNGQPTDHQASASPAGSQKAVPVVVPPLAELAKKASVLYRRYVNPVFVDMAGQAGLAKVFVRGEGCYLWDSDGRKYLDFVAGFGSLNLGHNHPRVTSAINRALKESAPGFAQSAINPYAAALAEQLVAHAPQGLEMVFLCNSGTESVEAALKLARRTTDREGFLSCDGSFHGKSLGALSVTGNPEYQKPFRPLLPN
ncbi:MAG: aminotransferase class III-fold pyridoxal phosphate-dependent enzyme, partial [Pirellulales bacterium]